MAKVKPTAAEKRHEARLHELPCLACGRWGIETHHVMQDFPGKVGRRDHRFQIPVCPDCHRGRKGIHGIGSEAKWAAGQKIDVPAEALRLWAESQEIEGSR